MDSRQFWQLVETLGGRATEARVRALQEQLRQGPDHERAEFSRLLEEHLDRLTTEPTSTVLAGGLRQKYRLGASDDLILFAACAVVASGQDAFDRIVGGLDSAPDLPPVDEGDSLLLLIDAPAASNELSGGSVDFGWLNVVLGESNVRPRWIHEAAISAAEKRLEVDPALSAWRESQGVDTITMHLEIGNNQPEWTRTRRNGHSPDPEIDVSRSRERVGALPTRSNYERLLREVLNEVRRRVELSGW